jgi:hypothetical protein
MKGKGTRAWRWLIAAVLIHFLISAVHGLAHTRAQVPLSLTANLFVFIVILAGPLIGIALAWPARRLGAWVIAVTMAGSLVFGLVNHFGLPGPDHVAHVDPQWRLLFGITAALLAITETLGSILAIRIIRERSAP